MSDSPDSPAATPGLRLAGSMRRLIDALSRNEIAGEKLSEACALAEQMVPLLAGPRRARWYEAGQGDSQSQGAHDAYLDQSAIRGELNPIAPPLVVERAVRDDATPCVRGHARMSLPYEGPPRGVHGGWVAALMDDLLGEAQHLATEPGVTAKLEVKYRDVTPLDEDLYLEAWIHDERPRRTIIHGTIHAGGRLTVEATGLFVAVDFEAMHARMSER